MRPETVQVSREDFYEEVRSKPVSKVAQKYSITGLSKICRKAGIPAPLVGCW